MIGPSNGGFIKVAEYKNGELLCMGDSRPRWLVGLCQYLKSQTLG